MSGTVGERAKRTDGFTDTMVRSCRRASLPFGHYVTAGRFVTGMGQFESVVTEVKGGFPLQNYQQLARMQNERHNISNFVETVGYALQ